MKKYLFLFSVVLFGFFLASNSFADANLSYNDPNYVGFISYIGNPDSSESSEASYINYLITLPDEVVGGTEGSYIYFNGSNNFPNGGTGVDGPGNSGYYFRDNANIDPLVSATDYFKNNNSNTSINLGNELYHYVYAKYDGQNLGAFVWYSDTGFSGVITLPSVDFFYNKYGLSHTTFFNSGTSVPEPAVMLLLGSGLVALAGFRRKFKK